MCASVGFDPGRSGYVFNIQRYTLHDGPGIRTMVFLNGCPLRCRWCSNPESQSVQPELALNAHKCIGTCECGVCVKACSPGAITSEEDGKIRINRQYCNMCFDCTAECPGEALHVFGALRSVGEVMEAVEADGVFFGRSGGGMTLSGGEPLLQSEFALALLREAKRRRINTAIETCGHVDWQVLRDAAELCNTVFFDIKCVNAAKHREFTGVDNTLIISNLRKLMTVVPQRIVVRTPLIPGFNDSVEDISKIIELLKGLPAVTYEVLPYHRLGTPKYEYLGREYPMGKASLDPATEKAVKELVKQFSLSKRGGNEGYRVSAQVEYG
jgi:pyruvate formate lyase activating enzyme